MKSMKKHAPVAFLLAAALLITLCACGSDSPVGESEAADSSSTSAFSNGESRSAAWQPGARPGGFEGGEAPAPPEGGFPGTPPEGEFPGEPPEGGLPEGGSPGVPPEGGSPGEGGEQPGLPADDTSGQNGTGEPESPAIDTGISAAETNGEFTVSTSDGEFTESNGVYTVTAAGVYTLSGRLDGQIVVSAGDGDVVELDLDGVTVTNGTDSPIKIISADKVEISAKSGTENVINDERAEKTVDTDTLGEGAIYAKADLKLKGNGTLVINAGYNNGVHTTKDLTVQKLSLKVTAVNNALKGNDSITVKSGNVVAISTKGDGVKTQNTDANKNGETRGDILLYGGSITVYAAGDGFQAAHDFKMLAGDGGTPTVTVYTGTYSGYTASDAATDSYKGVKAQNVLDISAGSVDIKSYDDGLHADCGTQFEAGGTGAGTVNISGGSVTMTVYSPETKTAGGRSGPGGMGGQGGFGGRGGQGGQGGQGGFGGWGGQQTVSGADGIHADHQLNISGGTVNIDSAYEGLEGNVINISGGVIYVTANDDGVNACGGVVTPQINVTGGYLDVTVPPNGDTDGIDSNGGYSQTGGVVITRGPNSEMAAAIDAERGVSVTGGTLVILGYGRVSAGGGVKSYSFSLNSAGSHTITIGGESRTFDNAYSYGRTYVYSDKAVS